MNYQTGRLSMWEAKGSGAQKFYSSRVWSGKSCSEYISSVMTRFWNVMLTFEETCTAILWLVEGQPSSLDFQNASIKRSRVWLHQVWRLRLLLLLKESSLFGWEVLFSPLLPVSRRCGSQKMSIMKLESQSFIGNVSDSKSQINSSKLIFVLLYF